MGAPTTYKLSPDDILEAHGMQLWASLLSPSLFSLGNIMTSPSPITIPVYTLTLNDQDLQIIMKGLEEQPFKFAAHLVNKISGQLSAQLAPAPPAPEVPEVPDLATHTI